MDNFLKSPPGNIPKKIHQIWIGPRQPPIVWLDTWRKKYRSEYPGWDYKLWGEAETAEIKMRNQVCSVETRELSVYGLGNPRSGPGRGRNQRV